MQASNDDRTVWLNGVPKSIWKLIENLFSRFAYDFPAGQGMFCYAVDAFQNAVGELKPKAFPLPLIPFSGSFDVGPSGPCEPDSQCGLGV